MSGCVDEALGGDPEVVVVEERDGVPFARQQDMQHVHDVRAVGDDGARLDVGFKIMVRGRGVNGVDRGRINVVVLDVRGYSHRVEVGVWVLFFGLVAAEVAVFEVSEAVTVGIELAGNLTGVVVPFLGRAEADAESRVVFCVVEVDDLTKNRHEG